MILKLKWHLVIAGLGFLILDCSAQNTHEYYKNDQIPNEIRKEIQKLNQQFFNAIEHNSVDKLYDNVFNEELKELGRNNIASTIAQLNLVYLHQGFDVKDEYFVPKIDQPAQLTIIGGKGTKYEYNVNVGIGSIDSYVSLLKYNNDAYLLGLIYRKYDETWKLQFFGVGQYAIMGKLPWDFYEIANEKFKKGYYLDATLEISLAMYGLKPNEIYRYEKNDIISNFAYSMDSLIKEKYVFPLELSNIKSKPKILNIHPQQFEDGIYPMIRYLTEINLNDSINLKKENSQIQAIIADIFPGIDKDKKYIIYTAHDMIPSGGSANNVFGFVQIIKED